MRVHMDTCIFHNDLTDVIQNRNQHENGNPSGQILRFWPQTSDRGRKNGSLHRLLAQEKKKSENGQYGTLGLERNTKRRKWAQDHFLKALSMGFRLIA